MLTLLLLAQLSSVQFYTRIAPETLYVGQQATYDAVTLLTESAQSQLSRNPEYIPPEVRGATVYDFKFDTALTTDINLRGVKYRRYVYRRAIFPLSEGTFTIPHATLRYSLSGSESYNSRSVDREIFSEAVTFTVLPLPTSGKPLDFSGAVGQFSASAFLDNDSPRLGQPITLTVRILGVGNLALLPRPKIRIDWADVFEGDESVFWDSTGSVVRGYKDFAWVITPKISGELFIPGVNFDFFNSSINGYAVATTESIPVQVGLGEGVSSDSFRPLQDTLSTSPFPAILRIFTDYWIVSLAGVLLVIFLVLFFAIRAAGRGDID